MDQTNFLTGLTGVLQLGLVTEGQVVPVIIGTIKEIKVLTQGQIIEYSVALTTGADELQKASDNFTATVDLINEEKRKAGLPPL